MRPMSIKLRLSLLVSLIAVAVILMVSIVAYVELEESLVDNVDDVLRAMGEGVAAALSEHEEPQARMAAFRSIVGRKDVRDPAWYRIWTDDGDRDLFASELPGDPYRELFLHPPIDKRPTDGESSFFNLIHSSDPDKKGACRAIWIRHSLEQQVVNVLVGRSSHFVYHELGEFYRLLLALGGGLTLLVFLLVPVVVSWGLNPIAQASGQLQTITRKNIGRQNLSNAKAPPELKPFVATLEEMLARLDKAMRQQEQFVADAAHELRTPVAVIKSTLQTARLKRRTSDEYEQDIDETLEDIGRLEHLIGQLLSVARFEAKDRPTKPTEVRLDTLLDSVVSVFDALAARQGGRVVLADVTCTSVTGNEDELRQLFNNLIENAVRHGPAKGTVLVTLDAGPDNRVTVTVHDEGGHIPPEVLPHLFDRFYRVDSSRSKASGGSGLGLAIAREIVLRHDGDITITSDPSAGTSVVVHLCGPHRQALACSSRSNSDV